MDTKAEQGAPSARTTLVIDRSKWLRGEGSGGSYLLRERDGRMCCLGFFGLACGVTETLLSGTGRPDEEVVVGAPWPEWLVARTDGYDGTCTPAATGLMGTNDNAALTSEEREERVAAIFAEHGVDVRFVDGASNG